MSLDARGGYCDYRNVTFLSTNQLAERLGLSPGTLANWRSLGKGPRWVKVGRSVRYRSADVFEWMGVNDDA